MFACRRKASVDYFPRAGSKTFKRKSFYVVDVQMLDIISMGSVLVSVIVKTDRAHSLKPKRSREKEGKKPTKCKLLWRGLMGFLCRGRMHHGISLLVVLIM